MHLSFGTKPLFKTIKANSIIVDYPFAYNVILGQTSLNAFGVVAATTHLAKKFPTEDV
jgi:hypothetical protein